jgi:hypothetical protein
MQEGQMEQTTARTTLAYVSEMDLDWATYGREFRHLPPSLISATGGIFCHLGLRYGDAVRIIGNPNSGLAELLRASVGREACRDDEQPDVYLVWASDSGALREQIQSIAGQMTDYAVVWAITALPGKCGQAGESIPQHELLDAGHLAGLADNRVALLGDCDYGYRFCKSKPIAH